MLPQPAPRRRPLTIVCHLLSDQAADGRVVGHVEIVGTGEVVAVADVAQLLELLTRCGAVLASAP